MSPKTHFSINELRFITPVKQIHRIKIPALVITATKHTYKLSNYNFNILL